MAEPSIQFEDRFVAYIDILGWSVESRTCSAKVVEAITHIHGVAAAFSTHAKSTMQQRLEKIGYRPINPLWLDHQVGAFSDNIVISNRASGGARILGSAADMQCRLLQMGFLCRGGVSYGQVYHRDAVVMGPALVEAVKLEKEANLPRIVISDSALEAMRTVHAFDEANAVFGDGSGRLSVNPIPSPALVGEDAEHVFREMMNVNAIEQAIVAGLQASSTNPSHLEKWRYMDRVIQRMLHNSINVARGPSVSVVANDAV